MAWIPIVRRDRTNFRSRSPRRRPDYSVAIEPFQFYDASDSWGHQYDSPLTSQDYNPEYYDDPYFYQDDQVETDVDFDGGRPGPADERIEEEETVERGRSLRPNGTGCPPPKETTDNNPRGSLTGETNGNLTASYPSPLFETI